MKNQGNLTSRTTRAERLGYLLPSVYQGNYTPLGRQAEASLFPALRMLGIRFYAYSPLAGGLLVGTEKLRDTATRAGYRQGLANMMGGSGEAGGTKALRGLHDWMGRIRTSQTVSWHRRPCAPPAAHAACSAALVGPVASTSSHLASSPGGAARGAAGKAAPPLQRFRS